MAQDLQSAGQEIPGSRFWSSLLCSQKSEIRSYPDL